LLFWKEGKTKWENRDRFILSGEHSSCLYGRACGGGSEENRKNLLKITRAAVTIKEAWIGLELKGR
jgi:transketolase